VITPSALNVLIIGLSVLIFSFIWRMLSAYLVARGSIIGNGMAAVYT
jgi:hypothetical protein